MNADSLPEVTDTGVRNDPKLVSYWKQRALNAESQVKALEEDLKSGRLESDHLRQQLSEVTEQFRSEQQKWQDSYSENSAKLAKIVRDMTERIARSKRKELGEQQHRLGRIVPHRTGPHNVYEAWEDGAEIKSVTAQKEELKSKRESLEKQQRAIANAARRKKAQYRKKGESDGEHDQVSPYRTEQGEDSNESELTPPVPDDNVSPSPMNPPPPKSGIDTSLLSDLERVEEEESVKTALAVIRREELKLDNDLQRLQQEKAVLQKDLKRCRDEESKLLRFTL
jgi:myosin heavy subunit